MSLSRPIRALIDLEALRHNYQVARQHAGQARVFAVIKANAYGHGLLPCARALAEVADGFAMLDVAEAVQLRDAGINQPILMLEGFFDADQVGEFAALGLIPVVHRLDQLDAILEAALPMAIRVFLKINSGMNRLGFSADNLAAARARLASSPAFGRVTMMTHFADADGPRGIQGQLDRFCNLLPDWQGPVCLANSAALLRHPAALGPVAQENWVRPGIMLYGASPFADQSAESLGLKPVMTLKSEIIAVQNISPGERVGYGGTFVADRAMRVGVVACGYADGYPRHGGTDTPILVDGRRTRTLGRVSMDMLACDLTDLPDTGVGSPVTLWGQGLPADEVATAAGTIAYELFTALAPRVSVQVIG